MKREAEEGPDQDDDGKHRHVGEGRLSGDGADDVAGHQQLQAKQDGPAELLAEAAIGVGFVAAEPDSGSTGVHQHADGDDGHAHSVDDLPDPRDHVVVVHGSPLDGFRRGSRSTMAARRPLFLTHSG
jgi:hypothetical protein